MTGAKTDLEGHVSRLATNHTRTDERATGELAAAVERRGDHAADGSWRICSAADRHRRDADTAETGENYEPASR